MSPGNQIAGYGKTFSDAERQTPAGSEPTLAYELSDIELQGGLTFWGIQGNLF